VIFENEKVKIWIVDCIREVGFEQKNRCENQTIFRWAFTK